MNDQGIFRITLVRHGESIGNAEERLQGHADFPLSELGRAQVRSLAQRWRAGRVAFDRVVSSPLLRAVETARILSAALASDFEIDPLWIERDAGAHAGLEWDRIDAGAGSLDEDGGRCSALGESDAALAERARRAVDSLLAREPARYLVVSHRALLNAALLAILGIPAGTDHPPPPTFRLANASFARLRFYPAAGRWQVDAIGDGVHWSPDV